MKTSIARYLPPGRWWYAAWLIVAATLTAELWVFLLDPSRGDMLLPVVIGVETQAVFLTIGTWDLPFVAGGVLLLLLLLCWRMPTLGRRICLTVARLSCFYAFASMIALLWLYR